MRARGGKPRDGLVKRKAAAIGRRFVRHCCYCAADETETELEHDRNHITGTVTIWCADRVACRARHVARFKR